MNKPAVLCVDDDLSILEGYRRVLGQHFELYLARGSYQGLEKLEGGPEYAVVVADMRMPEMDGVEFLKRVKARCPQTRRIMLSGDAEQSTAINAVNQGQVWAFLSKPCPSQALVKAVSEAAADWEKLRQERLALREVQAGAVKALLELIRAADPALYLRSQRLRQLSARILEQRGQAMDWQMEAAALLSQAGTLYLSAELRGKMERGESLDPADEAAMESHPALAAAWLRSLPGFEGIAQAIALQRRPYRAQGDGGPSGPVLPLASRVLRLAQDLDRHWIATGSGNAAWDRLLERADLYDPDLIQACQGLEPAGHAGELELREVSELRPGMRFGEDLRGGDGSVLARRGEDVGLPLAASLMQRHDLGAVLVVNAPA